MGFIKFLIVLIVCTFRCSAEKVTVYKSNSTLNSQEHVLSGMLLKNGRTNVNVNQLRGLTICVRFNFQILMDRRSVLYQIESGGAEDPSWKLAYFIGGDTVNFLGFGKDLLGDIPNWIVEKKTEDGVSYLTANRWHHLCMTYRATDTYIQVILV